MVVAMALFAILEADDRVALLRCGSCGRDQQFEPALAARQLQRRGYRRSRAGQWTCPPCVERSSHPKQAKSK